MMRLVPLVLLAGIATMALGCGGRQGAGPAESAAPAGDERYLLTSEPQDARGVIEVRSASQENEPVVVVGRIGGSVNPWVDGRAAFSIVDSSLKACDEIEGDSCKTPWDYCCESGLPKATVLVKVVDEMGELVRTDARELLRVKESQTVVVDGKAIRDEAGNLTVTTRGVYVKP